MMRTMGAFHLEVQHMSNLLGEPQVRSSMVGKWEGEWNQWSSLMTEVLAGMLSSHHAGTSGMVAVGEEQAGVWHHLPT